MSVAQSDGSDGRVVLQEETCRAAVQQAGGSVRSLGNQERLVEQLAGGTFGGGRERCPLDSIGLEAAVEHVVPQRYHTVLPPCDKTLSQRHTDECSGLGSLNNNNNNEIIIIKLELNFMRTHRR